jgi:hypothetical protein
MQPPLAALPGNQLRGEPGVIPTGGTLANAVMQGRMDVLEELRLLKDQVHPL